MALRSALPRPFLPLLSCPRRLGPRSYATVQPVTLVGKAPVSPQSPKPPSSMAAPSVLDGLILSELRKGRGADLPTIVQNYEDYAGTVLEEPLPYESRPETTRKTPSDSSDGIVIVAHAMQHEDAHKVTLCSGFALSVAASDGQDETVILTCAHTLEEMRNSKLFSSLLSTTGSLSDEAAPSGSPIISTSGSFVLTSAPGRHSPVFHPVNRVLSALHRSDLLLLSSPSSSFTLPLRTLPVSPYPAHPGTAVRAHVVVHKEPDEDGWRPWVGGTWSKWVQGTVLGYRDFAGREAQPGTYDALTHMLFKPLPSPGSSGGPIIDEESGAVIGVMLGTRMDNRVEGLRGWGVPSEAVFEMFGLPGLKLAGR